MLYLKKEADFYVASINITEISDVVAKKLYSL